MAITEKEWTELVEEYTKGNLSRNCLIRKVEQHISLNQSPKEAYFYHLLETIYEDPEDTGLRIIRESIIRTLDNYIHRVIDQEEFELWFWDVLDLNIEEDEPEEKLLGYLLYLFDNSQINGVTDIHVSRIAGILKNTPDAAHALKKIKNLFGEV